MATALTTSRFVGRPASLCRRCGGAEHWVNRMGGIVCLTCSPVSGGVAGGAGDVERLTCRDGRWALAGGVGVGVTGLTTPPLAIAPPVALASPSRSPLPRPAVRIYDWTTDEAAVDLAALAFTSFAERVGWNEPITGCRALMNAAKGR